jgi:hypothetical protein
MKEVRSRRIARSLGKGAKGVPSLHDYLCEEAQEGLLFFSLIRHFLCFILS